MRACDRIVAWTRVAPSFLPCFAVVTFPLRPPATHQAPNMLRRQWSFTPGNGRALSWRASSDGLAGMLAMARREEARRKAHLRTGPARPNGCSVRAVVGRALLPPGPMNAATWLGC